MVTAPVVTLTNNNSGNAVAPSSNAGAFTGDAAGSALITGTDGRLDPTDSFSVTFTVNVDPNAAGVPATLANTATAGGTPPSGTPVTDDSDTGTNPDGSATGSNPGDNPDGPGQPTIVVPPSTNPQLGLVKSVLAIDNIQSDGRFDVSYRLLIENTGDVRLTNLTLLDDLSASTQLGTAFAGVVTPPVVSIVTNASGNAIAPSLSLIHI